MSIFTMNQVNTVMLMDEPDARKFITDVIESNEVARSVTKEKAKRVILKHRHPVDMGTAMANWILAHPSEGLKVI